jgi:FixJ family two-component response regulator
MSQPLEKNARASRARSPDIVYVVDDDVSVRESLELLIRWAGWEPRTFASAWPFLGETVERVPGCLILDVGLPDLNGLDVQQRLSARHDLPIIFITGQADVPMTVRAMKAGAVEFLTKPFDDDALLAAVRRALEFSGMAQREAGELEELRSRYESLTRREREVMNLIVAGLLNKQVGLELGTSEVTVKAHRGRVMQKMRAASFADLVRISSRLDSPSSCRRR